MSKYGVFPVPYFSGPIYSVNLRIQFSPNTGKYGSEKIPYLDNFLAVIMFKIYQFMSSIMESQKQLPEVLFKIRAHRGFACIGRGIQFTRS